MRIQRPKPAATQTAPSAMIFARSINGLSHCEQEYSAPEDLEAGANVLLRAVLEYDNRGSEDRAA